MSIVESQFTSRQVFNKVLSEGFLSELEEIIQEDERTLGDLQKQNLTKGEKIRISDLEEMFREVKHDVDGLLGAEGVRDPKLRFRKVFDRHYLPYWFGPATMVGIGGDMGYGAAVGDIPLGAAVVIGTLGVIVGGMFMMLASPFNGKYEDKTGTIVMNQRRKHRVPYVLGHEYTHHVLHETAQLQDWERALNEGMSVYAGEHVSRQKAQRTGNNAYLFFALKDNIDRLKLASKLIKQYLENPDKTWLKKHVHLLDMPAYFQFMYLPGNAKSDIYAAGYSLLRIVERKFGVEVLRDVVRRNFERLESVT